jgi:putative spermidine/putrescine transport system ATP-binding protein
MPAITKAAEIGATDIGKVFGVFTALAGISLTVGRGEFLTLLGPSGSGKTTFLMILAGFEAPTTGRLTLDGRDMTATPAEERAFGMVFQGYALFPHMTVEDNIAFPLKVQKRPAADVRRRVAEIVEMVGLGGHGHKRPSSLSGGQQQRVALARALVYEPPVLLLDEPFSALDKNLRGQMQEEVRRLHRETGTTFVFVTHDQSEALALSTRIAIFEKGRMQQLGAPRDVYERPASRFVAEFLGDINILPLSDLRTDAAGAGGQFEGQALRAADAAAPGAASLAVRPEYMRLHLTRPDGGNAVAARLDHLTYLGAETRLALSTPGGSDLTMTVPTAELPPGLEPGAEVWAGWPETRGFLL